MRITYESIEFIHIRAPYDYLQGKYVSPFGCSAVIDLPRSTQQEIHMTSGTSDLNYMPDYEYIKGYIIRII